MLNDWESGCLLESPYETKETHTHNLYCAVIAEALESERKYYHNKPKNEDKPKS